MCNRENRQVIWCSYLEINVLGKIESLGFDEFLSLTNSGKCMSLELFSDIEEAKKLITSESWKHIYYRYLGKVYQNVSMDNVIGRYSFVDVNQDGIMEMIINEYKNISAHSLIY